MICILMAISSQATAAESLDDLIKKGYRVMSDSEFWSWYCFQNPEDKRCVERLAYRTLPKYKVVANVGDDPGINPGKGQHGVGSQDKGQGLDKGRGHDHGRGKGHNK
jgi:hypothetical protein